MSSVPTPPSRPPNNPAIAAGDQLYFGGIAPLDAGGKVVAPGDVARQTEAVLRRIEELLRREGLGLEHLVFVTVYLAEKDSYAAMNAAYARLLPPPYPARKVVVAPMFLEGLAVEMTAIAHRSPKRVV